MEDFSHSIHRNQPSATLSKKISYGSGFTAKTVYGDVFGGPPKFGVPTFSSRVEDYSEIFGSFHTSSKRSSIPILELPVVDDDDVSIDVRSSKFDYSEVFGGSDDVDFAVPYEELFAESKGVETSSEEAWTPAETGSPSDGSSEDPFTSEKNQCLSTGASHHALDGTKQFNMSYHKTNHRNKDGTDGATHIAQFHAIPGFTFVVDESTPLQKTEGDKSLRFVTNGLNLNKDFSGGIMETKHIKKTMSHPPISSAVGSDFKPDSGYSENRCYSNGAFVTVSEINLRTQTSQVPPPSRPPPKLAINQGGSKRLLASNLKSAKSFSLEGSTGDVSPPFFDVDVDASSSAAASAAAMKEAMEKAQARLKYAKELMQRKDSLQSLKKLGLKGDLKGRERKEVKAAREVYSFEEDQARETCERDDSRMKGFVREERQKTMGTAQGAPDSEERGILLDAAEESVEKSHRKESRSIQESHKLEERAGEWKAEKQLYELVNTDRRTAPNSSGQAKNEKKMMPTTGTDEHEQNKKASKKVSEWQEESNRKLNAVKEAHEREEYEKKMKAAQLVRERVENEKQLEVAHVEENCEKKLKEAIEREEHELKLKEAYEQKETEKKLKEVTEWEKNEKKQKEAREKGENEKKRKEACEREETEKILIVARKREENEKRLKDPREQAENEKRQIEVCQREENEKRLKEAHEQEKNEKRLKEAHEQEKSEKRLKEAHEQEGNEKRRKEACEREESTKCQKENCEREENKKRLKEVREWEENEKMQKEASEREEKEKILKDVREREENEKMQKEACEREEKEKILKDACEREENEKRQREAFEREENEKRLKEARELEENEKRQREAFEREENENRLKEACELEENEQRLKEAREQEETEKRQKESREREAYENNLKGAQSVDELKEDSLKAVNKSRKQDDSKNFKATQEDEECEENIEKLKATQEARKHEKNEKIVHATNVDFEQKENEYEFEATKVANEQDEDVRLKASHMVQSTLEREKNENIMKDVTHDNEKELREPKVGVGREQIGENNKVSKVVCDQEKVENNLKVPQMAYELGENGKNIKGAQVAFGWDENRSKFKLAQVSSQCVENGKKMETAHLTNALDEKSNILKLAQEADAHQDTERKEKKSTDTLIMEDTVKEQMQEERKQEKKRLRKIEEEREREREREKDRMAVERVTREARERAERAAVERATAEVRQRAMAEARERLEKASAEAREKALADKASNDARLRAERAAVERATAEARERAIEKAMAEKAALGARARAERSVSEKFSATSRDGGMRQTSSFSDLRDSQFQSSSTSSNSRYPNSSNHGASYASEKFQVSEGESAQRCKARLQRHQRTVERAAKALAEKNMRDLLAQREQAERNRLSEILDADVRRWSSGKEGNLRALLSTLQYILGPDSGWHPIPLTDVITAVAVKKAYRKATLCVHPDKLQQRGASIQQKYICEKVFDLLKEAWNKFNSEER